MLHALFTLAVVGFVISLYGYVTERKVKQDPSFKPACDISDKISCSKAMLSPYANILFLSRYEVAMEPHENSFYFSTFSLALIYYAFAGLFALLNLSEIIFFAALASCILSCYLAYLLFFKIKTLCILCTSLYLVNFLMLFFAYKAMGI